MSDNHEENRSGQGNREEKPKYRRKDWKYKRKEKYCCGYALSAVKISRQTSFDEREL